MVDAHPGVVYDAYAHASAFSQQCASKIAGGTSDYSKILDPAARRVAEAGPGRYVSTASVARDMVEMVEKAGLDKLKYWGFSYGTYLGVTFGSLFPDKVGRMVNDGKVSHPATCIHPG